MAGCFTLLWYCLAVLLTLLVPQALLSMVSYAPVQVASAVFCWLVPVGFFVSFWWGRRAMFRAVPKLEELILELEETEPMTTAERVALIWLTVDMLLLLIWLSLALAFGQVEGQAAWFLAWFVACAALLSAAVGYVLGYIPLSDRRKLGLVFGVLFSAASAIVFIYELFAGWREDPLVRWGAVVGITVSLMTVRYLSRHWDPAALEPVYHSRVEMYLDVLILTNGSFRFLFFVVLGGLIYLMNAIGDQFALTVLTAWLATFMGYASVQAWRHRPPPHSGLP